MGQRSHERARSDDPQEEDFATLLERAGPTPSSCHPPKATSARAPSSRRAPTRSSWTSASRRRRPRGAGDRRGARRAAGRRAGARLRAADGLWRAADHRLHRTGPRHRGLAACRGAPRQRRGHPPHRQRLQQGRPGLRVRPRAGVHPCLRRWLTSPARRHRRAGRPPRATGGRDAAAQGHRGRSASPPPHPLRAGGRARVARPQRDQLLDKIQQDEVRTGTVGNLCDFGAFVDLGGMDGLVHVSEIAWQRFGHPSECLKVGQEVQVQVLRVDRKAQRIGLSIERIAPDPWEGVEERFWPSQVVKDRHPPRALWRIRRAGAGRRGAGARLRAEGQRRGRPRGRTGGAGTGRDRPGRERPAPADRPQPQARGSPGRTHGVLDTSSRRARDRQGRSQGRGTALPFVCR